mgnify:CR=1 FL=1
MRANDSIVSIFSKNENEKKIVPISSKCIQIDNEGKHVFTGHHRDLDKHFKGGEGIVLSQPQV